MARRLTTGSRNDDLCRWRFQNLDNVSVGIATIRGAGAAWYPQRWSVEIRAGGEQAIMCGAAVVDSETDVAETRRAYGVKRDRSGIGELDDLHGGRLERQQRNSAGTPLQARSRVEFVLLRLLS